jgi:hypothetical protein
VLAAVSCSSASLEWLEHLSRHGGKRAAVGLKGDYNAVISNRRLIAKGAKLLELRCCGPREGRANTF